MSGTYYRKLLGAFEKLREVTAVDHMELILKNETGYKSAGAVLFSRDFVPASFENVIKMHSTAAGPDGKILRRSEHNGRHTGLYMIRGEDSKNAGFLIFQKRAPFDEKDASLFSLAAETIAVFEENQRTNKSGNENLKKYKSELMKMREMQAKMFPHFGEIEELDIGSIYLPAAFMTGNFVDAFFITDDIYQISICDVRKYDGDASFTGAAIRTLIRSYSTGKMVPSSIIELINIKLRKVISGMEFMTYITIYQINLKTGKVLISGYGELSTMFYSGGRKRIFHLDDMKAADQIRKRNSFKDFSVVVGPADMLLFYSKGAVSAKPEGSPNEYGIERLELNYKQKIEMEPQELVHDLVENIYDYTEYAQIENDIIFLAFRKN